LVSLTNESKGKFQGHLTGITYLHAQLKIQSALLLIPKEQEFWFVGKELLSLTEFQQHHLDKLTNQGQVRTLA